MENNKQGLVIESKSIWVWKTGREATNTVCSKAFLRRALLSLSSEEWEGSRHPSSKKQRQRRQPEQNMQRP